MLTTTITLLLLTLGALLAAFGVAGFLGNWTSTPDHDSIRYVQALAKSGRWLICTGLTLTAHHEPPAALIALLAALAAATYLTADRHHGRHRATTPIPARGMTRLPRADAATGVNR